jgi:Zn finger protein HypA/HybF involved in hydrogenase expression
MAKCKTCGTEAASPRKKWVMAGRADKTGKRTQLEIGLFDCPKCKKPFREVTEQEDYFDIARWGHIALRQKGIWAC